MKKLLLLFTILSISLSSFAASYRGMFDLSFGIPVSGEKTFDNSAVPLKVTPNFGGVFSMTHGCQILPCLFAGVGVGITGTWSDLDLTDQAWSEYDLTYNDGKFLFSVPIFLDLRWDLDIRKKITPYVDFKIGYQAGFDQSYDFGVGLYSAYDYLEYDGRIETKNSMYFQPTVGVRFKGGKRTGFNLGFTYNTGINRDIYIGNNNLGSVKNSFLMLNIGFDF